MTVEARLAQREAGSAPVGSSQEREPVFFCRQHLGGVLRTEPAIRGDGDRTTPTTPTAIERGGRKVRGGVVCHRIPDIVTGI